MRTGVHVRRNVLFQSATPEAGTVLLLNTVPLNGSMTYRIEMVELPGLRLSAASLYLLLSYASVKPIQPRGRVKLPRFASHKPVSGSTGQIQESCIMYNLPAGDC